MNSPRQSAPAAHENYEAMLARARELVPALRERAAQAESARVMPPETVRDLHASGILRALQPQRWGGMEFDFIAYVDLPLELSRGCASTGWNVVNLQIHNWMLAMYDARAQAEVWAQDPPPLIAAGIAYPQGRAERAQGGYRLSGQWNFSSCVNIAEWAMLAAMVREGAPGSERVVDHRMCLLHKSQYEVIDDWHTLGMRSTGSMTVVAKNVFVPEYRALGMHDSTGGGGFPGARENPGALYRISLAAMGGHGVAACAVGNAMAALEFMLENIRQRSTSYTGLSMRDLPAVQLRVSGAAANIDTAKLVLRADCFEAQEIAGRRAIADVQTKLRFKRNAAFAACLCTQAVDALQGVAGANGIYASSPLERIFRDAHALAAHISLNLDAQATPWGLAALGGEVDNPTL